MSRPTVCLTIILLLFLCSVASASQPISLASDDTSLPIGDRIDYLVDSEAELRAEQVFQLPDDRFTAAVEKVPTFFFGTRRVWARLTLRNDQARTLRRLLVLEMPFALHADLYWQTDDDGIQVTRRGWLDEGFKFNRTTLIPSYRIELKPGEERRFLLMVGADTPLILGLRLVDEDTFTDWDHLIGFLYSIFIVLSLGLAVFHFSIYYYNRKLAYLYIGPFAVSYAMIFYIGSGAAASQFPGAWVPACRQLFPFFIAAAQFWGLMFTRNFFTTRQTVPRTDMLLKILLFLSILQLLGSLFTPDIIFLFLWILTLFSLIMMCIVPVVAYLKGQRSAGLYLLGIITFAVMIFVSVPATFGLSAPQPLILLVSASGYIIIAVMATIAVAAEGRHAQALYRQHVKRLNWKLATTEERERRRIAEDLHDGVCQLLTGAKLQISFVRDNACEGAHREMFQTGLDAIADAYEQARKVIYDLNPPVLQNLGLAATLQDHVKSFEREYKLPVRLDLDNPSAGADVPDGVSAALLFRYYKELMTNVLKHAKASHVTVRLSRTPEHTRLSVMDDGIGFDPHRLETSDTSGGGLGLLSIRNQMERLGGSLTIHSQPGRGSEIMMLLPNKREPFEEESHQ